MCQVGARCYCGGGKGDKNVLVPSVHDSGAGGGGGGGVGGGPGGVERGVDSIARGIKE